MSKGEIKGNQQSNATSNLEKQGDYAEKGVDYVGSKDIKTVKKSMKAYFFISAKVIQFPSSNRGLLKI